jgi:hypothetical protein
MKVIEKDSAQESLANYVDHIGDTPLMITEGGKPVAVLIPTDDADAETIALSLDPKFRALIERSRQHDLTEKRLSSEEVRRLFENDFRSDGSA